MLKRRPFGLVLVLTVLALLFGTYLLLSPSVVAEQIQVNGSAAGNGGVQGPRDFQAQATPRATISPTPPTGTGGEGIPTPGVLIIPFVVGVAVGLAAGYLIWGRRRPTQGPIDRGPIDRGPQQRG